MVFQKPTLFPWLTVEKNIAFPLKMQGRLNDANGKEKVEHMLHVIGLEGFRTIIRDNFQEEWLREWHWSGH